MAPSRILCTKSFKLRRILPSSAIILELSPALIGKGVRKFPAAKFFTPSKATDNSPPKGFKIYFCNNNKTTPIKIADPAITKANTVTVSTAASDFGKATANLAFQLLKFCEVTYQSELFWSSIIFKASASLMFADFRDILPKLFFSAAKPLSITVILLKVSFNVFKLIGNPVNQAPITWR